MRKILCTTIVFFLFLINLANADDLTGKVLICEYKSPYNKKEYNSTTAIEFLSSRSAKVIRYVQGIYEPMKVFKYRYKTDIDFIHLRTSTSAKLRKIKIDRKKLILNENIFDKCVLRPNYTNIENEMKILFDTREYIKKRSNKI